MHTYQYSNITHSSTSTTNFNNITSIHHLPVLLGNRDLDSLARLDGELMFLHALIIAHCSRKCVDRQPRGPHAAVI